MVRHYLNDTLGRVLMSVILTESDLFPGTSTISVTVLVVECLCQMYIFWDWGAKNRIFCVGESELVL